MVSPSESVQRLEKLPKYGLRTLFPSGGLFLSPGVTEVLKNARVSSWPKLSQQPGEILAVSPPT